MIRAIQPALVCLVLSVIAVGEVKAGLILTRTDLDNALGGSAITEDFESWTGEYLFTTTFHSLDSSTIVDGQGPGIVNDGLLFTKINAPTGLDFLSLSRQSVYDVPSGSLTAGGTLVINFLDPITHAGFDFRQFNGFADTATARVYGPDDTSLLFTSPLLSAPNAPSSTFLGYADAGGIGQITIQGTNVEWSPLIDDLTYGASTNPVPEPASMALLALAVSGIGVGLKRRKK